MHPLHLCCIQPALQALLPLAPFVLVAWLAFAKYMKGIPILAFKRKAR